MSIITSLLDTDLYKLTMMQCIFHQFPETKVKYQFTCRNVAILSHLITPIQQEINSLCTLQFSEDELSYLGKLPFFKPDFINYLKDFTLNSKSIEITKDKDSLQLTVSGNWTDVILFEVPLLAIINETYFKSAHPVADEATGWTRLKVKANAILSKPMYQDFKFCDFGTRRRFSKYWHEKIVVFLKETLPEQFIGTSNVYLAKKLGLKPMGTMAHEYFQGCQVLAPELKRFQSFALQAWLKEYPDYLKVALTDVINTDSFLKDFDEKMTQEYMGLRHDSGNPYVWTQKVLEHYKKNKIDPKGKTLVYSDALTVDSSLALFEEFHDKVNMMFGIGTHLTNDLGYEPLQIIIKLVLVNNKPVAKISDSPTKAVCLDPTYLDTLKTLFEIET